uniref:Uncharacterized protein n=1 Tax=Florenciella parvula TaxID=236787 RepID=A0A7S2FEP3_9STRA|mmetsp:Transcript_14907/g.31267  ORF Transcript_14907/g.31267 Transcript_14907/m.31267 type:complete len:297 (+) Transcript_14907:94-984(+)
MPSKRFTTTLNSSLEAVAKRRDEVENRQQMSASLRGRKLANTQTSIVFGSDSVVYESDAMRRQKDILGNKSAGADAKACKELKLGLQKSNIAIGTDSDTSYSTTTGGAFFYPEKTTTREEDMKVAEDKLKLKMAIKTSSIKLGSDVGTYSTTSGSALEYKGNDNNFAEMKMKTMKLKRDLGGHNFEFAHPVGEDGDEALAKDERFMTSSALALPSYEYARYGDTRATLSTEAKGDLRKSHFELGYEKTEYRTDQQDGYPERPIDKEIREENAATVKSLKLALKKTSLVLGDDKEYF